GRHNARPLLASLARLLPAAGHGGLVLVLDLARLAEARRPPVEARSGVYYSKAAVLDVYEVLRQLIDATDELRGVLVVAVVPAELVTDETRGLPAYTALQLRVADEVRDRRRPNPFAALVRLEVRLEAVP
ncbi:MAG: ATP-binding protein, partial [Actinomycetota bacterium]|nr:ATP-binding protein [Actinomycetota bacterium]